MAVIAREAIVTGQAEIQRKLRQLGDFAPMALAQALYPEAEMILTQAKTEVPVDLGTLRESGHVASPQISRRGVIIEIGFGGPSASYAVYVHEGTGPAVGRPVFFPPIDALRPWMRRHGIKTEAEGSPPNSEEFLIARAIGGRGLQPTKFLERPFLAALPHIPRRVAERLRAIWFRIGPKAALPGPILPPDGGGTERVAA